MSGGATPPGTRGRTASGRTAVAVLLATVLLTTVLLAACGPGSGEGLDSQGNPLPPGGATGALCPSGMLEATWECVQRLVFDTECTHCHSGPFASAGLSLDEANSPDAVGRPSGQQPSVLLIAPDEPDKSYLVRKIEGAASISNGRMPLDGPPYLDADAIQAVRQWIAAGASVP